MPVVQWGHRRVGYITLPVTNKNYGHVFLQHNGSQYRIVKSDTDTALSGFTLNVIDIDGVDSPGGQGGDAHYLVVGF